MKFYNPMGSGDYQDGMDDAVSSMEDEVKRVSECIQEYLQEAEEHVKALGLDEDTTEKILDYVYYLAENAIGDVEDIPENVLNS